MKRPADNALRSRSCSSDSSAERPAHNTAQNEAKEQVDAKFAPKLLQEQAMHQRIYPLGARKPDLIIPPIAST